MLTRKHRQQRDGLLRSRRNLAGPPQVPAHRIGDPLPSLRPLPGDHFHLTKGSAVGRPIRVGQ